jgi:endonuclease-3
MTASSTSPPSSRAPRLLPAPLVDEAFRRLAARNPEPKGELEHHDAFTLLVAVVLSAQATDAGVNKATRGLFAQASTPAAMAALGEEKIAEAIKTIGLYRGKAKNVEALSRLLIERHGGEVPRERAALEALPGVGRKTANVVLNIAFGEPTIAVDTHVFRVSNRLRIAPGKTVLEVEKGLEKRVPDAWRLHAHHWLILHGRYICKALAPRCADCALLDICPWPEKRLPDAQPTAKPRGGARKSKAGAASRAKTAKRTSA